MWREMGNIIDNFFILTENSISLTDFCSNQLPPCAPIYQNKSFTLVIYAMKK